ncbi:MAG: hypothetical protein A4E28_01450 [Methanocella sp. PtaU1.Bin125]|nr:MAG: hypothetical protein A4E28_01450 [Methanocella sp. PtaU1.Bin125]
MKNERRIKVDFPNVDLTTDDISTEYIRAGKSIIEEGRMKSLDDFLNRLDEYNHLQYRLMDKTKALCKSMENMVDNDFVVVNGLSSFFDEIDRITERMDTMTYFVPRDEVLQVLEDYLSLHQRLFNKPMFFVESGYDNMQKYEL